MADEKKYDDKMEENEAEKDNLDEQNESLAEAQKTENAKDEERDAAA